MAVANSTPLIYLVKLGKLDLVVRLFGRILIPEAVYREVVVRGEEAGHPEAQAVGALIGTGKVVVERAEPISIPSARAGIHPGEAEAISLALDRGLPLLVDDRPAYLVARAAGIRVVRTVRLLLDLLEAGLIDLSQFRANLGNLSRAGFWLTADVYDRALREAERISREADWKGVKGEAPRDKEK